MSYLTENELQHFEFQEAVIAEAARQNGSFYMYLDNVKILAENSQNRDIRTMRTNGLCLKIVGGEIVRFVEEGYTLYDADGTMTEKVDDRMVPPEEYDSELTKLAECVIYAIEQEGRVYRYSIDTEDHTYLLEVAGDKDQESWERFMSLESRI